MGAGEVQRSSNGDVNPGGMSCVVDMRTVIKSVFSTWRFQISRSGKLCGESWCE